MRPLNLIREEITKEKRSKNWKKCIELSREAIQSSDPLDAQLQYFLNLSLTLFLMESDSETNINEAISIYNRFLKKITYKIDPQKWATLHRNLGYAYNEKDKSDKNFILAIKHYDKSLKYFVKKKFPEDWALIKTMQGMLFHGLRAGDRKENIQKATKHYQEALQILNSKSYPDNFKEITRELEDLKKESRNNK